jgi:hypothetical protein
LRGSAEQPSLSLARAGGPDSPVVIGIGKTGHRIVSLIAGRSRGALRHFVFYPDAVPAVPSSVPMTAWPADGACAARVAEGFCERVKGARSAVIACSLSARATQSIAPVLAPAVRSVVGRLAVVGVSPFAFEGPQRTELAEDMAHDLSSHVDVMAVAPREHVRTLVPPDTPLEQACARVESVAATAVEALAWALARGFSAGLGEDTGPERAAPAVHVGAGGGEGIAAAARAAIADSLLRPEDLGAARAAFLAAATGRAPSLGEMNDAEHALREALPYGTPVTLDFAVDASLAGRTLAAVCLLPDRRARARDIFPSEDPATLEIPAFLRRRSAGLARKGITGAAAIWKAA